MKKSMSDITEMVPTNKPNNPSSVLLIAVPTTGVFFSITCLLVITVVLCVKYRK